MAVKENQFQYFSLSSKNTFERAFTRTQHRASFGTGSREVIFAVETSDLLVSVFLAHPNDSAPLQILQHFGLSLDQLYKLLRSKGSFEPENAPRSSERPSPMPPRGKCLG
jgi:hypothetical protein